MRRLHSAFGGRVLYKQASLCAFLHIGFCNEIVQFGYGIASLKLFLGKSPVNWSLVQSCKVTIKITDEEDEHSTYSHLALSEAGSSRE